MFIGREGEIAALEDIYRSDYPRTVAVYGRLRVGKTTLVERFCEDKPHLRLDLSGTSPDKSMDAVSKGISDFTGEDRGEVRKRMNDFSDLIGFLESLEPREKTVVFMDELPVAAATFEDVPAQLKMYIDGRLREQEIMLIVCGSSVSGMMDELNGGDRPLFQRFPVQLRVRPLEYREARLFHPGMSEEDRVRMYAIASGIPKYHLLLRGDTAEEAIRKGFLGPYGFLRAEATGFISREFSGWTTYERMVSIIADGTRTLKGIAERMGMSRTNCLDMLRRLEITDVVERYIPYGKGGRSVAFRIRDGSIAFHYAVLARNMTVAEDDDTGWAFSEMRHDIDMFYGHRFEDLCAEYVRSTRRCTWIGRWEGKAAVTDEHGDPIRGDDGHVLTESTDIDVVAEVREEGRLVTLVGECNFTGRMSGIREFRELEGTARSAIPDRGNVDYIMFSRSGFTEDLRELACGYGNLRLELVDMDAIASWAESPRRRGT